VATAGRGPLGSQRGETVGLCLSAAFPLRLELPAEAELQRLVNAALNGYFYDLYEQMTAQLPLKVQTQLDELLVVPPDGVISPFESLKADAANPGVNNLEREISKLKTLRALGVPPEAFRSIPFGTAGK
jgi:hypothetical protein